MENVITVLAGFFLIGLLSYLARLVQRRLRRMGRDRSTAERETLLEAEVFTRSRLPF